MTTEPRSQASQRGSIPADSFAHRLMLARAHAGHLSIREAADLCGLGRGAWTNWEKGARPADIIDISDVVAEKLGVDRDWLLFGGQLGEAARQPGRSLRRGRGDDPVVKNASSSPKPTDDVRARSSLPPRPFGPSRRDSTRPVSAVPASKRRPRMLRPAGRPSAA